MDISKAFENAKTQIEKSGLISGNIFKYIYIDVPSVAMRYLLQFEGFPLGCCTQIIGPKASFKSMLALEIAKWHINLDGYAVYIDTEGGSAPLCEIILKKNYYIENCESMEEWQKKINIYIKNVKDHLNDAPIPVCFIIDSLTGVMSESQLKKISNEGYLSLAYPIEAKQLSAFMKGKSSYLIHYPFSLIGTNHIKKTINQMGDEEEYIPGGKALEYLPQLTFRLKKVERPMLGKEGYEAIIRISTEKNRLGAEKLSILVPVKIIYEDNNPKEVTFDWYAATTNLLLGHGAIDVKTKASFVKLLESEGVRVSTKKGGRKGNLYYCPELGVPEDKALIDTEFGMMIEENEEAKNKLYKVLKIRSGTRLDQTKKYSVQLKGG